MSRWILVLSLWIASGLAIAQDKKDKGRPRQPNPKKAAKKTEPNDPNAGKEIGQNKATPLDRIRVAKDFAIELLYSVPNSRQGSWINMCLDDKGRMIVSDQYGALYRLALPAPGKALDPQAIEKIPAQIIGANGLLWAFDALYVMVNGYESTVVSGLYKLTSSRGDDTLDKVELLRALEARNDHGCHAILPHPDGQSLTVVCGNGTRKTQTSSSLVPPLWGEDHLLPRMPDGRGFMREVLAPGGCIYRVSPDGKQWELISSGYRNIFDAAYNRDGELFTYDADMEYDFNTPWYRPTRINHVTSGSEYGWRNGAGKWAEWYTDNLPPAINIGPGSPTGVTFGYGAKFPAKYQNALFACDWSWGKLYAIHLKPSGGSYTAEKEEFVTGTPLPLTDLLINPADGALYFAIGGRKVQSGLYRVTYTGSDSTAPVKNAADAGDKARQLRHRLETFHGKQDPKAIEAAWPHLNSEDRFVRWAARVAVEHQPADQWADRALNEKDPARRIEALLALARKTGIDPFHRADADKPDAKMGNAIFAALNKIDFSPLGAERQIALIRTYQVALNRFAKPQPQKVGEASPANQSPDPRLASEILARLDGHFPAATFEVNRLLCEALVFLQSPTVASKAVPMLESALTQEEQMEYARSLRMLKAGWTKDLHERYFNWFLKAANYRGGASFEKFIEFIRADAVASLSEKEAALLKETLDRKPVAKSPLEQMAEAMAGRTFVKNWTLEDIGSAADKGMADRDFARGKKMFSAVGCFACHRFANEGGMTGPDLTLSGGRYSARDFIDQIINPSKVINEQFVPTVVTKTDGSVVMGVIVNLKGDNVMVNTDPTNPNQQTAVDRKNVVKMEASTVSPMPPGLINLLTQDEILDLTAFVLSGGDPNNAMFKK